MHENDTWSILGASRSPGCACLTENADQAYRALRAAESTVTLTDESHFIVSILRCRQCAQLFLRIFTELIDWKDGDDSQAWAYIPLDAEQARQLREAPAVNDAFILSMHLNTRHLMRVFPTGGEPVIRWNAPPVVLLPHD